MQIAELLEGTGAQLIDGDGAVVVTDLCDDSRQAGPGCAFVARRGALSDGSAYIDEAIGRGAVAVICEAARVEPSGSSNGSSSGSGVAWITANRVDQSLTGRLAQRFFGRPSRSLRLLGVTGTNGKTTTAFLIRHLLAQAGFPCGILGTICYDDGRQRKPAALTTPGPIELARWLAAMVANGCRAAVIEVSSHALEQSRTAGLDFDAAVFTNLTGDHLDYHETMEQYAASKARLFEALRPDAWAVVNADDPFADRIVRDCRAGLIRCHLNSAGDATRVTSSRAAATRFDAGSCAATVLALGSHDTVARLEGPWGIIDARLPLVGRHNVANVLQAVAAAHATADISRTLEPSLQSCPPVPGRLERVAPAGAATASSAPDDPPVPSSECGPTVLVDYAHTHDALGNALSAVRPLTSGRLTVVFGCGGDRDAVKRPKMGAVACRLADSVVITSDNPRTGDPDGIIADICRGVPPEAQDRVTVEPDRRVAIAGAIHDAHDVDLVLIAGKGHEDYQIVGTEKRPFDDRAEAAAALATRRHR